MEISMKKLIPLMCTISLLSGCSTFYLNQGMKAPNRGFEDRLPNMEAVFSNEDSLKNFTSEDNIVQENTPMSNRFYREVETNLIDEYDEGEKKGYLVLKPIINTSGEKPSFFVVLAGLTLFTSPLLGIPLTIYEGFSELELRVLNSNGKLVKKYTSEATVQNKAGLYYGGCNSIPNCYNKASWEAYEKALSDVIEQVYRDRAYLRKKLN